MSDERKGYCEGNQNKCDAVVNNMPCPLYGTLTRANRDGKRRVRYCNDPVAKGRRNRKKGDDKAGSVRRALNLKGANTRHEEHWGGALRIEIKAGQQVQPIETRFRLAEMQSEQQRPLGDTRPFVMAAMPDGTRDGIILCRLSVFKELLVTLEDYENEKSGAKET